MTIHDEPDANIRLRQLLTVLGPLLGVAASGMSNGYSAILLPQLKATAMPVGGNASSSSSLTPADHPHFGTLTIDQESWIAAAAVLPMAPGCWTGGVMAERLGRRMSMVLLFPAFFLSWLIIGLANGVGALVAGRLLSGYCIGVLAAIVPIYVSETSDPMLRGILLGSVGLTLSIGILMCHAMGTWLHWRTTAYVCGALPVVCCILCVFSRESPTWLLGRGRYEQARSSWIFLRGERSLEEFRLLEASRLADISKRRSRSGERSILRSLGETWGSRYFLRPLAIVCFHFFVTQFSGVNVTSFYCVEIFADILESVDAYTITLVIDAIRLAFGVLACVLLRTCRRRTLILASSFGVAVTMLALSASLTLQVGRPWVPVTLLVVYIALLPLGMIPVPWLLCGELFARKFRGLGSGLTSGFGFVCFFVVIKTMPAMMEFIKPEGTFAVYGSVALIGTGISYFVLPETKNKTLHEIQAAFDKKPARAKEQIANVPFLESTEKGKDPAKGTQDADER